MLGEFRGVGRCFWGLGMFWAVGGCLLDFGNGFMSFGGFVSKLFGTIYDLCIMVLQ